VEVDLASPCDRSEYIARTAVARGDGSSKKAIPNEPLLDTDLVREDGRVTIGSRSGEKNA
jgi:hypothetical protein